MFILKAILTLIFGLFFAGSFAQTKVPVYIFGKSSGGFDGASSTVIFNFFADSTFTLTSYTIYSNSFGSIRKQSSNGKYLKITDTLFLKDSTSIGYPFIKEADNFKALSKDAGFKLYPAKVILSKDKNTGIIKATYLSYLNIPKSLQSLNFLNTANLEMEYNHALLQKLW